MNMTQSWKATSQKPVLHLRIELDYDKFKELLQRREEIGESIIVNQLSG